MGFQDFYDKTEGEVNEVYSKHEALREESKKYPEIGRLKRAVKLIEKYDGSIPRMITGSVLAAFGIGGFLSGSIGYSLGYHGKIVLEEVAKNCSSPLGLGYVACGIAGMLSAITYYCGRRRTRSEFLSEFPELGEEGLERGSAKKLKDLYDKVSCCTE